LSGSPLRRHLQVSGGRPARIAVATVREDSRGEVDVTFACFDRHTLALYEKELGA